MAGLFNYWRPKDAPASPIATFTVVTTVPNQWMARIHNRMPVILQDNQINSWLDTTTTESKQLSELLKAPSEGFLDCYPVSRNINSSKVDDPGSAERIDLDYTGLLQNEP